ncbi:hypothetical protein JTB14_019343 [Gonioctena quinquepunctata]|nr:hypothetical protein JTB14_019343 [Gonioctena quinquepunctata]
MKQERKTVSGLLPEEIDIAKKIWIKIAHKEDYESEIEDMRKLKKKKYKILHNANKLKNSGISISVDLIAEDYEKKQFMVKQLKTVRQKQFNAKYKGNNLLINDTEYTYENLKQNPVENWTVRNGTEKENSSRKRTDEIEMENQEGNAKKYMRTRSASRNN